MRIQELEQMVELDRATIRFYEKEGLIEPKRSENGYRDYTQENAEELKKIRLLRQLGMSVFTIKQLQQGSADFSEALSDQVRRLSDQIEENKRAKAVCQTMYDDGAAYDKLDAEHYLTLLREIQVDGPKKDFQENVPKEIHPWRRWLARTLDYWWLTTLVNFVIIVLLRVRPLPNEFVSALILIASGALLIPVESMLLHKLGTTPGKFVMGIRLESANGGYLSFDQALNRSWAVYKEGMFFCVPYVTILGQWVQYLRLTGRSLYRFARKEDVPEPADPKWDEETEVIYCSITGKRKLLLAVLAVATIFVGAFNGLDSIKPKYRSEELTIAQFAEDYNQTMALFQGENHMFDRLNPDGSLRPYEPFEDGLVIYHGQETENPFEFRYETDDGILKSVTIQKYFYKKDGILDVKPMTAMEVNLALTMLLSRPDCTIVDFYQLIGILRENEGEQEVHMNPMGKIRIDWIVDQRNCTQVSTFYVTENASEPSSVYCSFTVGMP